MHNSVLSTDMLVHLQGAEIDFQVRPAGSSSSGAEASTSNSSSNGTGSPPLRVFTTRPDTIFGATYMVVAPEHPLLPSLTSSEQKAQVEQYVQQALGKSDLERTELQKDKTGVFTGQECSLRGAMQQRSPLCCFSGCTLCCTYRQVRCQTCHW